MLATLLRVFAGKVQTLWSPVELLAKCFATTEKHNDKSLQMPAWLLMKNT